MIRTIWPLLLGMCIVGMTTGLQNTLLSIRAEMEGFSSGSTGMILAGYFIGFLLGAIRAPKMIHRVGHIRAFAALAALASISILVHAIWVNTAAWFVLRMISGFCFSAIFVIAESWINAGATNQNRGKLMSLYVMMLFGGIGLGQFLLYIGDPRDFLQFTLVSILISAAVIPLLITQTPAPGFGQPTRMRASELLRIAPMGVIGCFLMQFAYASLFGLGPVYFSRLGLELTQIANLVAILIFGSLCCQFQLGKLSDRFDRRLVISGCAFASCAMALWISQLTAEDILLLYASYFVFGAVFLPIFSMVVAHTNDYLNKEQMVGASSVLVRANGQGAICGLLISGVLMQHFGTQAFFWFIALIPSMVACMALYMRFFDRRQQQRRASATVMLPTQSSESMIKEGLEKQQEE
ncbi:MFS transporter [Alkalimonas collagenimarina]|uniref:MFS transporter n=1 Tax=Alkalimonas collagenimarina TaxID=400390 RepID=A0ABT9H110_9GAMM|nr:MFS transporter [Alkalimonas collagenimarina]MDP4537007.1 MFS transporter [Alkalimonas collagenimarina]